MPGKPDKFARVAAVGYSLVVAWVVGFTFAFFGFDLRDNVVGGLVFVLFALSPILVCLLCFRRD